jgi:ABC-2 type transport system permease protein
MAVLVATIALFFSGSYIPLPFLPPWLHALAVWSPFNGLLNVPAEVFLGKLTGGPLLFELVRQIAWIIILVIAVRTVTAIAARRVEVQGG